MLIEWKAYPFLDGVQVSSYGSVRKNNRIIHPSLSGNGYLFLPRFMNTKSFYIHRMVAETFLLNNVNFPIVDHINGDKLCNQVDNLRWTTRSINANNVHVFSVEARTNVKFYKGEIELMQKLRAHKVNFNLIGAMFEVSGPTVRKIVVDPKRYLKTDKWIESK